MAPPGRRLHPSEDSDESYIPSGPCASSACCLGEDDAVLRSVSDDKYRKRSYQRNQKRLRGGMLLLGFALCVLLFTFYTTTNDKEADRLARIDRKKKTSRAERKKKRK